MKKLYYESPTVEVVDVRVEGGFGLSDGGLQTGGVDDYTYNEEGEMDSFEGDF